MAGNKETQPDMEWDIDSITTKLEPKEHNINIQMPIQVKNNPKKHTLSPESEEPSFMCFKPIDPQTDPNKQEAVSNVDSSEKSKKAEKNPQANVNENKL